MTKTKSRGPASKVRRSAKRKPTGGSKSRNKRRPAGGAKGGKRRATGARRSRSASSSVSSGLAALIPAARALAIGLAVICLAAFCYWAVRVTFTPVRDHGQAVGNTQVGHSLRFYLDRPSIKEAIRQIGGNLALLAPLGVLLPIVFRRLRSPAGVIGAGALTSVVVETVQGAVVTGRAFDIDDVLLNVVGVTAAYLLAGRRITKLVRG